MAFHLMGAVTAQTTVFYFIIKILGFEWMTNISGGNINIINLNGSIILSKLI